MHTEYDSWKNIRISTVVERKNSLKNIKISTVVEIGIGDLPLVLKTYKNLYYCRANVRYPFIIAWKHIRISTVVEMGSSIAIVSLKRYKNIYYCICISLCRPRDVHGTSQQLKVCKNLYCGRTVLGFCSIVLWIYWKLKKILKSLLL